MFEVAPDITLIGLLRIEEDEHYAQLAVLEFALGSLEWYTVPGNDSNWKHYAVSNVGVGEVFKFLNEQVKFYRKE